MSISSIALNANSAGNSYKSLNYGQGYGNYQNQYNAEDKTSQNKGQFSMNHSANSSVDQDVDMTNPTEQAAQSKKIDNGECETCKNRKYQDVSDDSGVSYQTPTKISPSNAASAVMSHEQEHVVRNQAKAERDDREVLSQSVVLHTAICPECGKAYVSGGTTTTVTKADTSDVEGMPTEDNGLGGRLDVIV
ncbi:hypothetical protein [Aminipila sp.]|uniref:hypothetical protein n=1 Tax=Aminipila sp. TaxID=2060095 RepID=UPI0028983DB2|nr:hypothetical protein [Aminipila sp.]